VPVSSESRFQTATWGDVTVEPLRIVVSGYIGQYPLGGVAWDYIQYFLGLRSLGHDVYYIEDTGQWPYNPGLGGLSREPDVGYNVKYLARLFAGFDAGDRWGYRFFWTDSWYGLSDEKRRMVLDGADLVLNVSGSLSNPGIAAGATKVYVDTDPVFTQVKMAKGNQDLIRLVDAHDVLFTVGEAIAGTGIDGRDWLTTRHPIAINEWENEEEPPPTRFTTVMNWTSYKDLVYEDRVYGQKDGEIRKFVELPSLVPEVKLELAMNEGKTRQKPVELLEHRGWRIVDPEEVCGDLWSYRSYIAGSSGEWSVAKGGYVEGRSGWFSGRSAAYLASGRPTVVQDTGFSTILPTGDGIVPFRTLDEAVSGLNRVASAWKRHSRAARDIAVEYFDAERVLARLIDRAGMMTP
jgi:hypothetical protein